MSFSLDVKKEVLNLELPDSNLKAELYGIIKLKGEFVISNKKFQIELITTGLSFARRVIYILKKLYSINIDILSKKRNKLDYKTVYYLLICDKAEEILIDLELMDKEYNFIETVPSKYNRFKDDVLRGMFLSKGSINQPGTTNYHLEIVCNLEEDVKFIVQSLDNYNINAKVTERRGNYIVYVKKSESIGDFLKIIGSTNMLFYFENERIKRDLNNTVNRVMNCDLANSDRTQMTALKQLEEIKLIEDTIGYQLLSTRLMEAVILRTTHPDSSLSELSELSEETIGRYLSKSGISHCLKDLHEIAISIEERKKTS